MKKLLLVALVAASFVGMVEARHCRKNKCEVEKSCGNQSCLPPSCVVERTCNRCEAPKPNFCYLKPAPARLAEHTETTVTYSCLPCNDSCCVKATSDQLNQLIDAGAVLEGTQCGL